MKLRILRLPGLIVIISMIFSACGKESPTPSIEVLLCNSATFSAPAAANALYAGVATVNYGGGNGLSYPVGRGIQSSGVTGLTAALEAGNLASGVGPASAGSLMYKV